MSLWVRAGLVVALVLGAGGCDPGAEPELEWRDGAGPITTSGEGGGYGDAELGYYECSVYDQDCEAGFKCVPLVDAGAGSWSLVRCTPVADDPKDLGEVCTVKGRVSDGVDDCERGLVCWDLDPNTQQGRCAEVVLGNEHGPVCTDPRAMPNLVFDSPIALCLPGCDPVDPSACPDGQACLPRDDAPSRFSCAPESSGDLGKAWDPCDDVVDCNPGLTCVDDIHLPTCPTSRCCTPYCEHPNPDCQEGFSCVPWYAGNEAPPGFENVGVCRLP